MIKIEPQQGPQYQFLNTLADIAIYGGSAGSGKSYALLLEPLRHYNNPKFGCVIFRKNSVQVRNEGGLWHTSQDLYPLIGGVPKESVLEWTFPSGCRIKFSHLEHENTVHNYQGSQIALIGFDELTHFSERQFWYLLSRNRSNSGVPGYIRATTNPDADHWTRKLIDWWIDPDSGYPIPDRSGVLRWFIRVNDELHWSNDPIELTHRFPDALPKSLTFIPARLEDNPILMLKDPGYKANLDALPILDRMRLKEGNWNAKASAGNFFKREWFETLTTLPMGVKAIRYWDRASSEVTKKNPDPDYTVGMKMVRDQQGLFYVADLIRMQASPHKVEQALLNTAKQDGTQTTIWLEQDPGQAGVVEIKNYSRLLAGYDVRFNKVSKDKQTRAKPASAQAEAGNVKILSAPWNEEFLRELSNFPDAKHDDIVDTLSGCINCLVSSGTGSFTREMSESNSEPIISVSEW